MAKPLNSQPTPSPSVPSRVKSGGSASSANGPTTTGSPTSTTSSVRLSRVRLLAPWLLTLGGLFVLATAGVAAAAYAVQDRTIVRNTTVGGIDIGSLTSLEALEQIEKSWASFSENAFTYTLDGKTVHVPVTNSAASVEEVVLEIASFDPEKSVAAAFQYGHTGPWWRQAWERFSGYLGRRHEFGRFNLTSTAIEEVLRHEFSDYDQPAVNASIAFSGDKPRVTESKKGRRLDYAAALAATKRQLRRLDATPISLRIRDVQPDIPTTPALTILADRDAAKIVSRAPLALLDGEKRWMIDEPQLRDLVGFTIDGRTTAVGLDRVKTSAFLEKIRPAVDVAPRDAKFSVTDGRVEEFQTSVVGRELDAAATVTALQAALSAGRDEAIAVVTEVEPLTDTVTTNDLGITELVAEARTNFRGSPPNRVFNLSYGAKKLHGLLIKPGETFSLVQALGPIDQKNGWKPELVIKGARITPEFGGGLCQVATTLFRTALNAGLPITERRNHSLRISYYEPPIGLDATIYEPNPDLKFLNDYGFSLLLQTRVEGTELVFSFYGTKDGRTVDLPEPRVFNRVPIPPTQYIEVDDLKPGEEECQAPGHPGADAIATYTVKKANGETVTQEFKSHYRALPVICRVGKKT